MEEKICCVTGHRGIPTEQTAFVQNELCREIEKAIMEGYIGFMSGFAEGVDQWFAEIVMNKRKDNPTIRLYAAIPTRQRLNSLRKKKHTAELLDACAEIIVIQEDYHPSVYAKRNRYMVERSDCVIAVYDGREKGGTLNTIRLAHKLKKELREIPVGTELIIPRQ